MTRPPPMDARERTALRIARDALDLDDAAAEAAYLVRECGDDAALLARATALRDRFRRLDAEALADEPAPEPPVDALIGQRLGPFRVIEQVGRGGMGVVYRGEREDADFTQETALKLVRRGFDFDDVHARFLRERRILARLSHPNLARFIDGGVAPDGRPWFALEFVRGQPLTRWCDTRRSSLRDRVRLFLDVCAAVQYAHGQLVVHRDLKPANVLVDDSGSVRLLDFGIARLLGGDDDGALTRIGSRYALTPEYAAPEQFASGDVGVSADVYSLGVILYELLCGVLPVEFDRHEPGAAERAARDTPPQPLSQAIARDPATLDARLLARATGLRGWRKTVRGDLARIVGKALEKAPERRYGSVDAFAADLSRWLAGSPVRISGNGIGYRFGKFVARNRVPVALFVVASLALVLGSVGVLLKSREALFEAERANAVQRYLVGLFESATPGAAADTVPDVRELLARGAGRAQADFADQPRLQAEMLGVLGHIHVQLGLYEQAAPLLSQSIALRRAHPGDDTPRLVDSLVDLARVERLRQHLPEARVLLDEALTRVAPDDAMREGAIRALLGVVLAVGDDPAAGERELRRAVDLHRASEHPPGLRVADSLNDLAVIVDRANRHEESLPIFREALALRRAARGDVHVDISQTLSNLGESLRKLGRLDEAETALREAVTIGEQVYDAPHPTHAVRLSNLAIVLQLRGDIDGAIARMAEALRIRERVFGANDPRAVRTRINLAPLIAQQERYEEALAMLDPAVAAFTDASGEWRTELAYVQHNRGRVLRELGRLDEADAAARQAVALFTTLQGEGSAETLNARAGIGRVLLLSGRREEALDLLQTVLDRSIEQLPPEHPRLIDRHLEVGDALAALGRHGEARPHFDTALAQASDTQGDARELTRSVRLALAATLARLGDTAAARDQRRLAMPPDLPVSHALRRRAAAADAALRGEPAATDASDHPIGNNSLAPRR